MILFGVTLTTVQIALLAFIVLYGLAYGIRNWVLRMYSTFVPSAKYNQSSLGVFLDYAWLIACVVLANGVFGFAVIV